MKISYNTAAMFANNALNAADSRVSQSLKRLSSGLKITAAKDNPSGYAIGRRMNAQIAGVTVATQNSNRGINIVQTADGALNEVHDMLQRMNELAIKGAHGVLTTEDRSMLDAEMKQLKEEITRIASDTEFNGQTLLDGSFDLRGYTDSQVARVDYYSDEVLAKEYKINALTVYYNEDGTIDLKKTKDSFVAGEGFPEGVEVSSVGQDKVTITGPQDFKITLAINRPDGAEEVEVSSTETAQGTDTDTEYTINGLTVFYNEDGVDVDRTKASFQPGDGFPEGAYIADVYYEEGDESATVLIVDKDGNELTKIEVPRNDNESASTVAKSLTLDITGIGSMDMQTGANEGQQLAIRIPTISLDRLGIERTEVTTEESSTLAITEIKGAIQYVSDARSRLGAYQNRLEHTVNNLDVTNENMTSAYSNIMDADMAEEMTTFTTQQVIAQAATSMLAQANERPSQVLQLLQ